MTVVTIVDASPLIYSVFNTVGHLSTKAGTPTGLRYGVIRALNSYRKRTKADRVVVVYDTPGAVKKAEGVEEYKSNREWTESKATMYSQVDDLKKMIDMSNFTQAYAEGYEADDVIGCIARRVSKDPKNFVWIVSVDNDMAQLVNETVKVFNTKGKKKAEEVHDRDWVFEKFGVYPESLLTYRSIMGDTSDNLKGICGGSKSDIVQKYLNDYPPLDFDKWMNLNFQHLATLLKVKDIDEADLKVRVNENVMRLHNPSEVELIITKGGKDPVAMENLFTELEFKSMMKSIPDLTR